MQVTLRGTMNELIGTTGGNMELWKLQNETYVQMRTFHLSQHAHKKHYDMFDEDTVTFVVIDSIAYCHLLYCVWQG